MPPDAAYDETCTSRSSADSGWTISDSEWNGFVAGTEKAARRGAYITPLFMIGPTLLAAVAIVGYDQWNRSSGGSGFIGPIGRLFWIAIVPINALLAVRTVRSLRRFARAAARVRAEDGCVCPTCGEACAPRNADGFAPRCRHGISRDMQGALIECWQAIARRDFHAVGRLSASLPASDAPRGLRARLQHFVARGSTLAADAERPFRERYVAGLRASIVFIPMLFVITSMPTLMPTLMGGSLMLVKELMLLLGVVVAAPFFAMSGAARPAWLERCRACRQLLARARPARCTECGSDLLRPAAVESVAQVKQWRFLGVGAAIFVCTLLGSMAFSLGLGSSLLPTPVLIWIAPYTDTSTALSELATRTLSPQDRARLVEMLISNAAPGANLGFGSARRTHHSSNLVLPAVVAGDLPASTIDDALRAMVRLDADIDEKTDGSDFVLTPAFGDDLFDRAGDAWVVFRGVSFDGATPIGASTNPIDRWSVDPIWRSGFQRESHPTAFTVPCPAGARSARWRATVVLLPFAQRPAFSFEEGGSVSPSPNAIGSIEIEGTIELDP